MVREILNNLTSAIEKLYYRHGMFCSCHAYRVITCTCLIIVLMRLRRSQFECKYHLNSDTINTMFFSIGIFCSPLIHGNAVIEWRPESSSRAPPWLSEEPLASVQHVMLQLKHKNPFEVTGGVCDVRFEFWHIGCGNVHRSVPLRQNQQETTEPGFFTEPNRTEPNLKNLFTEPNRTEFRLPNRTEPHQIFPI